MKFKVSINCISLAENLDHLTFRSFLIFSFLLSNALFPSATKIFELQPLLLRVALGRPAPFHLLRTASSMIELSHMCRSIKPFGMDYFFCTRFLFWFFNFFFWFFLLQSPTSSPYASHHPLAQCINVHLSSPTSLISTSNVSLFALCPMSVSIHCYPMPTKFQPKITIREPLACSSNLATHLPVFIDFHLVRMQTHECPFIIF